MSALAKVGAGIRNAWRHYRWRWHEPGGKADSWNPVTGREKEYPRPKPYRWPGHHQREHGQGGDTDQPAD